MNRFTTLLAQAWRQLLLAIGLLVALGFLMLWRITTAPKNFSLQELATKSNSFSWHKIWHNPINAPFTALERVSFLLFHPTSAIAIRLTPAIFGGATIILFYSILRFWFDTKTAILGSSLLACTSWFLSFARTNTPDILFMSILLLIGCSLWIKHSLHRNPILLLSAIIAGGSIYIPGMIWFLLIGAVWRWRSIQRELSRTKIWIRVLAVIMVVALVLPLGYAVYKQPSNIWTILGLPSHAPTVLTILRNFGDSVRSIFYNAPFNPAHTVGHQPVFGVFMDAMFFLGVYQLWRYQSLDRSRILIGVTLIGLVLTGFGVVSVAVLLPSLYLVVTLGIIYMLDLWYSVFPNNPIARTVGMTMLTLAVIFACTYQLRRYFVAWPNSPTTAAVFSHKDLPT